MSDEELKAIISRLAVELDISGIQQMGQLIGAVKSEAGTTVDGAAIARLVKEWLL